MMTSQGSSVAHRLADATETISRSARVDGGSVAVVSTQSSRLVLTASDSLAAELETRQADLGEGPYVDACTSLVPILVPDLRDEPADGGGRWPFFASSADSLGVRAVFAFPLRVSDVALGSFGLYRRRPGELTGPQLGLARTAVDDITRALLDDREDPGGGDGPGQRQRLASSAQLHQAAGMVMIQLDVSILEAMSVLRATAFAEGVPLADLVRDVVGRRRRLRKGARDG